MQFVHDLTFEPEALPGAVGPGEPCRIDHLGRSVGPVGLKARRRVGPVACAVEPELVSGAVRDPLEPPLEQPTLALHERLDGAAVDDHVHRPTPGRPDPKCDTAREKACAEPGHTVQ